MVETELPNHIQDLFDSNTSQHKEVIISKSLFDAKPENIAFKTELTIQEVILANKLMVNNKFLISLGLKPVFDPVYISHLYHKVSHERKSRTEYVDINKKDRFEEQLNKFGTFANLTKAKQ